MSDRILHQRTSLRDTTTLLELWNAVCEGLDRSISIPPHRDHSLCFKMTYPQPRFTPRGSQAFVVHLDADQYQTFSERVDHFISDTQLRLLPPSSSPFTVRDASIQALPRRWQMTLHEELLENSRPLVFEIVRRGPQSLPVGRQGTSPSSLSRGRAQANSMEVPRNPASLIPGTAFTTAVRAILILYWSRFLEESGSHHRRNWDHLVFKRISCKRHVDEDELNDEIPKFDYIFSVALQGSFELLHHEFEVDAMQVQTYAREKMKLRIAGSYHILEIDQSPHSANYFDMDFGHSPELSRLHGRYIRLTLRVNSSTTHELALASLGMTYRACRSRAARTGESELRRLGAWR